MLMYKFVTLLSSLGKTSQVVPMVSASIRINYIILLVKYKLFASIKNRIIIYKLIRYDVAAVNDTVFLSNFMYLYNESR